MELTRLSIQNFRNIEALSFSPASSFNLFYGDNGAGKTSILESIHALSQGRSFRGASPRDLINNQSEKFMVSGDVRDSRGVKHTLGVERSRSRLKGRVDFQDADSIARLAECLPLVSIHPGSFELITGEPGFRRAYIDWGLFFCDPQFRQCWPRYQAALKQRNAALKKGYGDEVVGHWDIVIGDCGETIDCARRRYVERVNEALPEAASFFSQSVEVAIEYRRGWDEQPLLNALASRLESDRRLGYTFAGPHRADLVVKYQGNEASRFASRGQIKFLTVLLKLVQARLYQLDQEQACILLLDDLASELDSERLAALIRALSEMRVQTFVTSVEKNEELFPQGDGTRVFHVKQGRFSES
ncbi:MAG TPA: DNA replication/repair protein RecF [Gammaproteobacteria bacterium]|nr:DNA replication/repair protein RecF [Gammaproteobacteria bacterium]